MKQKFLQKTLILCSFQIHFFFSVFSQSTYAQDPQDLTEEKQYSQEFSDLLERALLQGKEFHPWDIFRLLQQEKLAFPNPNSIQWKGIYTEKKSEDDEHFFEVLYREKPLLKFNIEAKQVGRFGDYVVFIEKNGFVEDQSIENLYFIDLKRYRDLIGKSELPVFRIPVRSQVPITKLAVENSLLTLSGEGQRNIQLSENIFEYYADVQEIGFNIQTNLLDPKSFSDTAPLIQDIQDILEKSDALAASPLGYAGFADTDSEKVLSKIQKSLEERVKFNDDLNLKAEALTETLQKKVAEVSKQKAEQKKLFSRVKMLWGRLSLPKPQAAVASLRKGLALALNSLIQVEEHPGQNRDRFFEGVKHVINSTNAKSLFTGSGAFLLWQASQSDPAVAQYALNVIEFGSDIFTNLFGKASSFFTLGKEAFSATLAGFKPQVFYDTYLQGDNKYRFGVGLTAAFSMMVVAIGTPHVIVSFYKLGKDLGLLDAIKGGPSAWVNFLKTFKQKFIARQSQKQNEYLANLADPNGEKTKVEFTDTEITEVRSILASVEKEDRSWFGSLLSWFKRPNQQVTDIKTLWSASTHFLFSYSAFADSGTAYSKGWNYWFMFRTVVMRPLLLGTLLYYPNYFKTVTQNTKKATLPTITNGGLRPFYEEWPLRVAALFGNEALAKLRSFENKIISAEEVIQKIALRKASQALLKKIDKYDDLKKLMTTGGIGSITDPTLFAISAEMKTFFKLYFSKLSEAAMEKYIAENKDRDDLSMTEEEAETLVSQVEQEQNIHTQVESGIKSLDDLLKNISTGFNMYMTGNLDPSRNLQISRFQSVNRQVQNPQAMARAVRATVASMIVDKPMELGFLLMCLAGIEAGINKPMHEEMFGPNSFFYMGRYPVLAGFTLNLIMGVFSNIWMKLQQDELHEDEFKRLETPPEKYKDRSFFRWTAAKTFSPENTLAANQKHYVKIIWANMRAALATYLVTEFIALGRFDIDLYLTGYLMVYTLPTGGMAFKIEQGFELASGYFARNIPEKYRSHPEVQKYLNGRIGVARIGFNVLYKVYENMLGFYLEAINTITTPELGNRSFTRWIFGGKTPTEILANSLESARSYTQWMPGSERMITWCQNVFINNYTDGANFADSIKDRLQPPAPK